MLNDLLRKARYWKFLNFRKLLYLPKILSSQEKRIILFLILILLASGSTLLARVYLKFTRPVPQVGGSYSEGALREPRVINPVFANLDVERDLAKLIFSSLITYAGDGKLKLDLAENFEISEDGKTYVVTLKKNVQWHDGKFLNADDVIFTIKLIQNPQFRSPLRSNWQGVTVEKTDDYTLRFSLKVPYAPFIENLALGILPRHLWESISPEQAVLHELNLKPIGSGPYQFDTFKQSQDGSLIYYRLIRNKKYYTEGPYLKTITLNFFKNEEEALKALRRSKIDGFGPLTPAQVKVLNESQGNLYFINMPRVFGIFFNGKKAALLENKVLRTAVAHAVNKKEIASSVSQGSVIPLDMVLPPGNAGPMQDATTYDFNPDKSRKLLEDAGWKDTDGDGIRDKKKVEGKKESKEELRFIMATSDWPDLIKTAELLKTQLKNVGIEITIETRSFTDLETDIIRPRNFDMLLFGQVYGYEPDPFSFWHSSQIKDPGLNITAYSNKNVDKLLEEARKTPDKNARIQKYADFQNQILKDLPAVFLYSQLYLYTLPSNIQGVNLQKISLPADRFNEINLWYKNTQRVLK